MSRGARFAGDAAYGHRGVCGGSSRVQYAGVGDIQARARIDQRLNDIKATHLGWDGLAGREVQEREPHNRGFIVSRISIGPEVDRNAQHSEVLSAAIEPLHFKRFGVIALGNASWFLAIFTHSRAARSPLWRGPPLAWLSHGPAGRTPFAFTIGEWRHAASSPSVN